MKDRGLVRVQVDSVKNILGRLKTLRESRKYNPGYLVDRNNINKAIHQLEDLLDRYKEAE